MPPPPRKYDAGDRAAKKEELRRLAEAKRQRELAAAGPPAPPPPRGAPDVRPGPKDPVHEGRGAKLEEQRRLAERRAHELTYGVRMRVAAQSRWKEQAEAQSKTVDQKLRDLFGEPGAARKPTKDRRRR